MRARGALLAAVILAQAVSAGAAPRILLRSGDAAADGLRLDGFRLPAASSAGQVALLATTSGILREDGGVLSDRKSTRLNSSHLVISYAVFCLQKKNTA